jgi:hypothetical protein
VTKRFRSSLKFCLRPERRHYFVHDHNGRAPAYVYSEEGSGRRSAAKLVSKNEPGDCGEYREVTGVHPAVDGWHYLGYRAGVICAELAGM